MSDEAEAPVTRSMTDEMSDFWREAISREWQIWRLIDWANMLEKRVLEFDPDYRAYPWGRKTEDES